MALMKTIKLPNGVEITDAYIKIDNLTGNKDRMNATVGVYVSQDYAQEGLTVTVQYHEFTPSADDSAANYHKQGYEHLKALSNFADAIDC